jgi:hypothetical protein
MHWARERLLKLDGLVDGLLLEGLLLEGLPPEGLSMEGLSAEAVLLPELVDMVAPPQSESNAIRSLARACSASRRVTSSGERKKKKFAKINWEIEYQNRNYY